LSETETRLSAMDQRIEAVAQQECYRIPVSYLRCLKGVNTLSALTLIAEVQDFERFKKATSFMGFTGLVSSEHSSGQRVFRGSITKMGNRHIRRILIEAAWHYRRPYTHSQPMAERRRGCPIAVIHIAHRAEE